MILKIKQAGKIELKVIQKLLRKSKKWPCIFRLQYFFNKFKFYLLHFHTILVFVKNVSEKKFKKNSNKA